MQGDFVELLPDVVRGLPTHAHVVVFHCWALTYVARDRRPDLAAAIAALGAEGRPVSWLSAEAPRVVPGIAAPDLPVGVEETQPETVLGLRRWRRRSRAGAPRRGVGAPPRRVAHLARVRRRADRRSRRSRRMTCLPV